MISGVDYSASYVLGNYLRTNNNKIAASLEKLGSGLRVRSPADDAGAYFIASTLERRAATSTMVAQELEDNIAGLSSALDALNEVKSLVEELRDIANSAANTEDADFTKRETLATEYENTVDQINEIIDEFSFNGSNLLKDTDGGADGLMSYEVTIDEEAGDTYTYQLWESAFTDANGLNLGDDTDLGVTHNYADADGSVYTNRGFSDNTIANPSDAAAEEKANATLFYNALNGTNKSEEASGLVRIDRNIMRVSTTLQMLEGRRDTLLSKAANYESAREALVGVDEAAESTVLTSSQMLQQAGAFFLAQANSNSSTVAKLIFGRSA